MSPLSVFLGYIIAKLFLIGAGWFILRVLIRPEHAEDRPEPVEITWRERAGRWLYLGTGLAWSALWLWAGWWLPLKWLGWQ